MLANAGVRMGGTDFDSALSLATVMPLLGLGTHLVERICRCRTRFTMSLRHWATINFAYSHRKERELAELLADAREPEKVARLLKTVRARLGHRIFFAVEDAKIALSEDDTAAIELAFIEAGLRLQTTRAQFEDCTAQHAARLRATAAQCIADAGIAGGDIGAIFFTGGSSRVPFVRAAVGAAAPLARRAGGSDLLSVAMGLTREAGRRFQPLP